MNQYNLLYPDNKKVYFGKDPKSVATRVFKNIGKNHDQARICLEHNDTKKKYHFVAFKKNILNEYKELLDSKNSNQIGGNEQDDAVFYTKLNELSSNINLSVNELVKVLKTKYDPYNELMQHDKVFSMLDEGIKKINEIDNKVKNINSNLGVAKDVVDPTVDSSHLTNPVTNQQMINQPVVNNQSDKDIDIDIDSVGSGSNKNDQNGCLIM